MRIALIDRPTAEDRPDGTNRFASVGKVLEQAGHEVVLLDGAPPASSAAPPLLTGLNRAVAAAPMTDAHALAHHLAGVKPDLVVAPLRGGIAQGVLMARTCGEAFADTRVAVWCDTPSRARFIGEEGLFSGLAPLIADALERQVILFADALILPSAGSCRSLSGLERRGELLFPADLPVSLAPRSDASPAHGRDVKEIVFAGPLRRHAGMVEFIAAIERVTSDGLLAGRTVTFLGPARAEVLGVGSDWLGFRAASWTFPFKIVDVADAGERARYLAGPSRLAVAVAHDPEELLAVHRAGTHHIALLRGTEDTAKLVDLLVAALRAALSRGAVAAAPDSAIATVSHGPRMDWAMLVSKIAALPLPAKAIARSPAAGVSVCVLHRNRLAYLAQALASVPNEIGGLGVELIVVDNASDVAFVEEEIRKLAGPRELLRVIRFAKAVPQAFAFNRAAVEARYQTVVFLDDDNQFTASGVERMARALAGGELDIVVTALEIFDDGAPAPSAGRLIFLGAAHSAGLFFNAFGDTAMAVRRESFLALGGFHDAGYSYSHLDWVTLAKAQAAGLRIGALQWPAVRYRRNTTRADVDANKIDQEGARFFVFQAYGVAFDAGLVARYAQKLHLEEL